jgi:DNA-binding NtrC family response regulator
MSDIGHGCTIPNMAKQGSHTCVLVVDDDVDVALAAKLTLGTERVRVETATSPATLRHLVPKLRPHVVLLDMNFATGAQDGREGLDCLRAIHELDPSVSVVLMTAYGDVALAVQALKQGATDFTLKPWQNEKLIATVHAAIDLSCARREAAELRARNSELAAVTAIGAESLIGESAPFRRALELMHRAAPTDANILILGESGTGKELAARAIHSLSNRASQPFVSVDLAALPESLFESELFGHRRGAFTGAFADRAGRFQAAHGGTLFLDEVGDLSLHLQKKLLTALERREVVPVGTARPVGIDVRVIAATNRPRDQLARDELFRQDLLFRINTVELVLPPLRERQEDIRSLIEHFLPIYAEKYRLPRKKLSAEALRLLESYHWPGNIRELKHAIERATILGAADQLGAGDFSFDVRKPSGDRDGFNLAHAERDAVARALAHFAGNLSQAAIALGITRPALYRRIRKYGL